MEQQHDLDELFTMAAEHEKNGKLEDALTNYQAILAKEQYNVSVLHKIALIYEQLNQLEECVKIFARLSVVSPDKSNKANFYYYKGRLFKEKGNLNAAFREYTTAIKYDSKHVLSFHALLQLSNLYNQYMLFDSAKLCHDEISKYYSNQTFQEIKLLSLHYNPKIDAQTLFKEHVEWGRMIEAQYQPAIHSKDKRPLHQKLRIGYVSPDFYVHPVACFIKAILKSHDKSNFQVYLYSNVKKPDMITEEIKSYGHFWRDFGSKTEKDLFDMICQDEIDILVDLAGHTTNSSLRIFACKPSPIAVTWIGYPNTTGLSTIDYRLTDEYADPIGLTDKYHTEELFRLPHSFLCYSPYHSPPLAQPPVCKNGYITFGSYTSDLKKITPETIALWSLILRDVEDSRFIMKSAHLGIDSVKERVEQMFENNGVESSRILLKEYTDYKEHLNLFNDVDIILDSTRYSGTTTTCEALWMGVPVITLAGDMHVSRVTTSILTNIGLKNLVGATENQCVRIAKELSQNIPLLKELRQTLRDRMACSPMMDAVLFTKNLENAYRIMWKRRYGANNK